MTSLHQAVEQLRALNEPVPIPIPLPSFNEVMKMEEQLGISFNDDYRTYLLQASDVVLGTLEPATITEPDSHTHLPSVIESARKYGLPDKLLPFCEDNSDYYCLNESGEVIFWSHNGISDDKWPSLADWIIDVWIGENG